MFYNKKTPYIEVPCFDGSRIHIDRFLMDRKTPKTALEFVNGYLREQGASQMVTNPLPSKKGRRPAIPQVDPSAKSLYPPNHKFDPNPDPSEVKRANKARWTKRGGRGKAA
ncbi:hypothetical protein IWQ56_005891 [Coemansia nantahalensis]|nr:hypothetical protein IWQ56_005891 [Coemansia nantahalensis]